MQKTFQCNQCEKSYTNNSHLRRHIKTSHELKPVVNEIVCRHPGCHQGFTNFSNMERHFSQTHIVSLPYECKENDCKMKFHRKFQLKKHLKESHDIGSFTYACNECEQGFFNQVTYFRHLTTHKVKERVCEDCSEIFTKWTLFVKHRREAHKKLLQYQCDLCSKFFLWKTSIRTHMKLHLATGETLYQCHYENCPKFYNAMKNLTAHIRSKHEGKKFTCPVCKLKMSTKQKLDLHIKGHEGNSKFIKKPISTILTGIKINVLK